MPQGCDFERPCDAGYAPIIMLIWSPVSKQAADQHVRVSYMWLTSGATREPVLARGHRRSTWRTPLAPLRSPISPPTVRRPDDGLVRCRRQRP